MDDTLLDDFFNELNQKMNNKKFIKELQEQLDGITKNNVEELIKKYF